LAGDSWPVMYKARSWFLQPFNSTFALENQQWTAHQKSTLRSSSAIPVQDKQRLFILYWIQKANPYIRASLTDLQARYLWLTDWSMHTAPHHVNPSPIMIVQNVWGSVGSMLKLKKDYLHIKFNICGSKCKGSGTLKTKFSFLAIVDFDRFSRLTNPLNKVSTIHLTQTQ